MGKISAIGPASVATAPVPEADQPLDISIIPACVPLCPPDAVTCTQPLKLRSWLFDIKRSVAPEDTGSLFTRTMFESAQHLFPKEFEGALSFEFFKRFIGSAASNLYQAHTDCDDAYRKDHPGQEIKITVVQNANQEEAAAGGAPQKPPKKTPARKQAPNITGKLSFAPAPPPEKGDTQAQTPPVGSSGKLPSKFMPSDDYAFNHLGPLEQKACESAPPEAPPDVEDQLREKLADIGAVFRRRDESGNLVFSYGRVDFTILPNGSVLFDDLPVKLKGMFLNISGVSIPLPGLFLQIGAVDIAWLGPLLQVRFPGLEELGFKGKNQREKREILEATHDLRFGMFKTYREWASKQSETYKNLHVELSRVWASSELSLQEKKNRLFDLWDICLGGGDEDILGDTARAVVIAFVNAHLPAGSPDAFTAKELADLNARRESKEVFAPYDSAA